MHILTAITKTGISILFLAIAMTALFSTNAQAQYTVTNLVSNEAGVAPVQDTDLVNGWGLTRSPTSPFWVSDNVTGKSTLYTGNGTKMSLTVIIPPASGTGTGTPTGTVFNETLLTATPGFVVSKGSAAAPALFLFDTLDGTISGWNPGVDPTHAQIAVPRSGHSHHQFGGFPLRSRQWSQQPG
jgi:uncharacterized protein (TIGR03118 family)